MTQSLIIQTQNQTKIQQGPNAKVVSTKVDPGEILAKIPVKMTVTCVR